MKRNQKHQFQSLCKYFYCSSFSILGHEEDYWNKQGPFESTNTTHGSKETEAVKDIETLLDLSRNIRNADGKGKVSQYIPTIKLQSIE